MAFQETTNQEKLTKQAYIDPYDIDPYDVAPGPTHKSADGKAQLKAHLEAQLEAQLKAVVDGAHRARFPLADLLKAAGPPLNKPDPHATPKANKANMNHNQTSAAYTRPTVPTLKPNTSLPQPQTLGDVYEYIGRVLLNARSLASTAEMVADGLLGYSVVQEVAPSSPEPDGIVQRLIEGLRAVEAAQTVIDQHITRVKNVVRMQTTDD